MYTALPPLPRRRQKLGKEPLHIQHLLKEWNIALCVIIVSRNLGIQQQFLLTLAAQHLITKLVILAIFPGFARKVALSACTACQRARTVRWVSNVPAVAVASLGEEGSSCVQYPPLFRRHHRSCIFTTRCSGPKQELGDKWVACAGRGVSL